MTLKGARDCIEGTKAQIQEVVKELVSYSLLLTNAHNVCACVLAFYICLSMSLWCLHGVFMSVSVSVC